MKRLAFLLVTLALVFSTLASPLTVLGADQDDIDASVDDGLAWLASQQNPDGSWGSGSKVGHTGLVLAAFNDYAVVNGMNPLSGSYAYSGVVQDGLNYIFSMAQTMAIGIQPAGNPDGDGDGIGVNFGGSVNYETGIALMAIASSNSPTRTVTAGGPVNGWTYRQVAQDVVDYLSWSQCDGGLGRGGWYYSPYNSGSGTSDNSISGWVSLGLGYAQGAAPYGFGLTIPQFVLDELDIWIDYIQTDVTGGPDDGGSGYTAPGSWVNSYKTGHLLYQMGLEGDGPNTGRVQDALDYLSRHWNDDTMDWYAYGWQDAETGAPWYIACAAMMKGFVYLGIDQVNGIDWFEEFSDALVAHQSPDGRWASSISPHDDILATAWALLTLQKAAGIEVLTAPKADFTAQPRFGPAKLTVKFTDLSQGDISTWRWNFGDGTTSSARNSTHTYTKKGSYTVKLTVAGPGGEDTAEKIAYVTVTSSAVSDVPEPPKLSVSYLNIDPAQVLPNQEVTISANICNSGEERGTKTVSLVVNGEAVASQSVGVSGGSCQQVVFRTARAIPGTYQVAIDGMAGQFSVLAPRTVTNNVPSQQQTGLGTAGIIAIIAVIIVLIAALIMVFRRT